MPGTTLASAYVQILPTTKGIKGNLENELGGVGESAGRKSGGRYMAAFGKIAMAGAVAVGAAIGKSVIEGAKLEQSIGGVETLYGKSAQAVIKNADKAWKTAGISANQYMEQSTSFAAALLNSLDGDTQKAAKAANTAIMDMSDNANKMGTDIESIQMAYQGFARGQYVMLDNLKLGYGGTKQEMERLLADAEKLTGQDYDINNLADVYEAIHAVQKELGVTGTTAKEGASTISGSFAAMRASAQNFLGNLSMRPELVNKSLMELVDSTSTFVFDNLIPAIGRVFTALPGVISTLIQKGIPQIINSAKGIINGLGSALGDGDILSKIMPMFADISTKLPGMASGLIDAGIGLVQKLAQGIAKGLPALIQYAPVIITNLANIINNNAPKILVGGWKIVVTLVKGIISAIPLLVQSAPQIFRAFMAAWQAVNWLNLGKIAFNGIKKGMQAVIKTLKPMVRKAFNGIKNAMLAPSRLMVTIVKNAVTRIKQLFNLGSIVGKVRGVFTRARDAITRPIQAARDKLRGIISRIKGLFPLSIGKIFTGLKVPSISVSGGKAPFGIAGKGSLPKFHVNWNAEGGIFDRPTVLQGVGEAGAEAVVPLTQFWRKMDNIAAAIGNNDSKGGTAYFTFVLDGKVIGQTSVDYINEQTITFGVNPVIA